MKKYMLLSLLVVIALASCGEQDNGAITQREEPASQPEPIVITEGCERSALNLKNKCLEFGVAGGIFEFYEETDYIMLSSGYDRTRFEKYHEEHALYYDESIQEWIYDEPFEQYTYDIEPKPICELIDGIYMPVKTITLTDTWVEMILKYYENRYILKVDKNTTGVERKYILFVMSFNTRSWFEITQRGE